MDAHGVYVLNGADHDDVICEVAHDLELELLPACDALFDEGAPNGASVEAVDDGAAELAVVGGRGPSLAAEGEAGADDEGEGGLGCQGGEQRVGSLAAQYLGYGFGRQWLDVGCVCDLRVRHNSRRVGVYEDYAVTLLAQGAASLCARVVELRGLPDHYRTRA